MERTHFIRFVQLERDSNSHRKQGILVACHYLLEEGALLPHEEEAVNTHRDWFMEHLPSPSCLRETGNLRALSWFKSTAAEAIDQMWPLVHVLRSHGIDVEMLKTTDPGVIVYEDEWQVVARPKRDQKNPW